MSLGTGWVRRDPHWQRLIKSYNPTIIIIIIMIFPQ